MPTYEYECLNCRHKFEIFQSINAKPKRKCPECKGKVRKLFGAGSGIIFKGPGFYATDYRSKDYKKKAEEEVKSKSATGDKSVKKQEKGKSNNSKL